jgi:hypothetical protein
MANTLWQGLEALGLLRTLPSGAVPNLAQTPSLPLAIMQMFGAFKKNDMGVWLGADVAAALSKTTEGRKLLQSFSQIAEKYNQARQETWRDNWQPLPLPLLQDDKWHILPLFYRHQENQQQANPQQDYNTQPRNQRVTRFLVQMPHTAWGQMQLDGFLQNAIAPNMPTQLDMVLRTETALETVLMQGLQTRYAQVLGALGYVGQINVQVAHGSAHVVLQPLQPALKTQS